MERRFSWLAFPGFLRFYALFHVLALGLQLIRPDLQEVLEFDRAKIFSGEVWRLVTFLFASSGGMSLNPINILFYFFAIQLVFMFNDGLEGAWGAFRTSIFCYFGILTYIVIGFFLGGFLPGGEFYLYASAFFAFATLFPTVELRVMLLIPVQVKYLAMLSAFLILLPGLKQPISLVVWLPILLIYFSNYILFVGIPALRGGAKIAQSAKRRRNFKAKQIPETEAFHRCTVCDRTEISDPDLEFRIDAAGREYCEEHLPEG